LDDAALGVRVRAEVGQALAAAGRDAKALPVAAFPAAAYATLATPYAHGRSLGEVEKRLRLLWATATGRV
jgi:phytoene synthase